MNPETLEKVYQPHQVEARWYPFWLKEGFFAADPASQATPFSIVIPPPNVTGSLHMGHALNNTLQDILVRYRRMDGAAVFWLAGTDHAGIATQNVVERILAAEGKNRFDLGREKFIERVWEWKKNSGGAIRQQLMRLGCSCDWSRERFTMDQGLSKAVRKVFVQLYQEGLIYRDHYIINWCPRCLTALSDLEVEHEDQDGHLYYIRYPLADDPKEGLVVATTRPETMLGDTAVAVHPDDPRAKTLAGKKLELPLTGRQIPVIADAAVEREFGTGAVKITPAHDFNDFATGQRHHLPRINIFDEKAYLNENAGVYQGLSRDAGRAKVLADLEARGLLVKTEKHPNKVGHCYRCKEIVEPYLSRQWFVRTQPLAQAAIAAVERGQTAFVPKHWENTYFEWMRNIRDWCISRQIWWGHRIPAWSCSACRQVTVAEETPQKCEKCGSAALEQESDVLDTWFSSALWPFSTMGWPEKTPELKKFYPTTVLITAFDIIFFWVARMMMMGLKFMGQVPFKEVYIHALVRDAEGKKMSKSKGNVIDPLTLMDRLGTDAFRFALAAFAAQGRDITLSEKRIEGYRNFCNKIWNAARFVLMNTAGVEVPSAPPRATSGIHAWIQARLSRAAEEIRQAIEEMRFNEAASAAYRFTWLELCDWYLEFTKKDLYSDDAGRKKAAQENLLYVFDQTLRLLHPFMPFITEEIWQKLARPASFPKSIMIAPFPKPLTAIRRKDEEEVEFLIQLIRGVRTMRGENNIPPGGKIAIQLKADEKELLACLAHYQPLLQELCNAEKIEPGAKKIDPFSASTFCAGLEVFVPLRGLVDPLKEIARLTKENAKAAEDVKFAEGRLHNQKFIASAPEELVEEMKGKLAEAQARLEKGQAALKRMETFKSS